MIKVYYILPHILLAEAETIGTVELDEVTITQVKLRHTYEGTTADHIKFLQLVKEREVTIIDEIPTDFLEIEEGIIKRKMFPENAVFIRVDNRIRVIVETTEEK